jgi:hypothetical protein
MDMSKEEYTSALGISVLKDDYTSSEKADGNINPQINIQKVFSDDNKLNLFLNGLDQKKGLQVNPISRGIYMYDQGEVQLEIDRFDKGDRNEITLRTISSLNKNVGNGRKAMQDITDIADSLGYTITLDAKPFGNDYNRLGIRDLVNFYKASGFNVDLNSYNGAFQTDEEMIAYAEEYEGDSVPMYRKPKVVAKPAISVSDVKMKKSPGDAGYFDGEYQILYNGNVITELYYDREAKSWRDLNYTPKSAYDYYGDMLGDNKAEAIQEVVRRYNKSNGIETANFQIQNFPLQHSSAITMAPIPEGENIDEVINKMFSCE